MCLQHVHRLSLFLCFATLATCGDLDADITSASAPSVASCHLDGSCYVTSGSSSETTTIPTAPGSLVVPLTVANDLLADGSLPRPAGTKRLWIEVGANNWDLLVDELNETEHEDVWLITFEPIPHKYAFLVARHPESSVHGSNQGIGFAHPRARVFPMAIVAGKDGLSWDMLSIPKADSGSSFLGEELERRDVEHVLVPTISLEVVLREWLRGHDVDLLKVDAQGKDLQVLESAGREIERIKAVVLELHEVPRYTGGIRCSDAILKLDRLGFEIDTEWFRQVLVHRLTQPAYADISTLRNFSLTPEWLCSFGLDEQAPEIDVLFKRRPPSKTAPGRGTAAADPAMDHRQRWEADVRKSPGFAAVHLQIGRLLADADHLQESEVELRHALMLYPGNSRTTALAHHNLAVLLGRWQHPRLDEAAHHYERSLDIWPEQPLARQNRGLVLAALQQWEAAIKEFQKALQIGHDSAELRNALGAAWAAKGRHEKARAELRRALVLQPGF
jgi:FkbM family methyltransferase